MRQEGGCGPSFFLRESGGIEIRRGGLVTWGKAGKGGGLRAGRPTELYRGCFRRAGGPHPAEKERW